MIPEPNSKARGYFALLVTSIVWGTTWVASKIGVTEIPALEMAAIRQFIGGLLFLTFFIGFKKLTLPTKKEFVWLFFMAILMFVLANGLSTWSIQYIPTGLGALIGALYPLFVVIIERVIYKNKNITPLTLLGLFLGVLGIGIVFYQNAFHTHPKNFFVGITLALIAVLAWSLATIFITRNKVKLNPYYALGWQMFISSGILILLVLPMPSAVPLIQISLKVWLVIGYLVLLGSIAAFIAFIYSMKKLPAAISSLYAYINPLVAMVIAYFVLNEKLTINILWGAMVTLLGVFLVNYSVKKSGRNIIEEIETNEM